MNEEENKKDKGLSLAEFQPAEAQLQELAARAKTVDTANIREVHSVRIELRDARTALAKKGKELREGALVFQKRVIAREKDLLAIILADEERLEAIENEAKVKEEMEKRRVALPTRRAALDSIGLDLPVDDETLLKMDDAVFNEFRLSRIERKLQADREAAEAEQRKRDAEARAKLEAEKAEFEKQKKAEEDRIRKENDESNRLKKIEADKLAAERAEVEREKARLAGIEEQRQREAKQREDEAKEAERQKILKEQAAAAEEKKRKADKDYQDWLVSIGYDEKRGDTVGTDQEGWITCWRPIGTYYPKNE